MYYGTICKIFQQSYIDWQDCFAVQGLDLWLSGSARDSSIGESFSDPFLYKGRSVATPKMLLGNLLGIPESHQSIFYLWRTASGSLFLCKCPCLCKGLFLCKGVLLKVFACAEVCCWRKKSLLKSAVKVFFIFYFCQSLLLKVFLSMKAFLGKSFFFVKVYFWQCYSVKRSAFEFFASVKIAFESPFSFSDGILWKVFSLL